MKMSFIKSLVAVTAIFTLVMFVVPVNAQGLNQGDLFGGAGLQNSFENSVGLNDTDPRDIAAQLIRVMLGFLGLIAVVIIMLGGFKWMTAGGNEDKVVEAKGLMAAGVIGMVIVMASYGLASFVMNAILAATV